MAFAPARCDVCRLLVLLDCMAELVVFVAYLWTYETQRQLMISDTLFAVPHYAILLTVFMMVRMMFGVLYVATRRVSDLTVARSEHEDRTLLHRRDHGDWSHPPKDEQDVRNLFAWAHSGAYAGFLMTGFGWVWLCRFRQDPDHVAGVFVFAAGSILSSLCLVQLARMTEARQDRAHSLIDAAVLVTGGLLAISFMFMYFTSSPVTWIVEHVAYALHLVFWGVFFSFHWHVHHLLGDQRGACEMVAVMQCQPLLPPVRLTMPQTAGGI